MRNTFCFSNSILIIVFFLWIGCTEEYPQTSQEESNASINKNLYKEPFRPQFHFTPSANWMGRPEAFFYYHGQYHLFYHYKQGLGDFEKLEWGHATSTDLVIWEELPPALGEFDGQTLGGGSMVIEKGNKHQFCTELGIDCMLAFYNSYQKDGIEGQVIAFSDNGGRSFLFYENNPVSKVSDEAQSDPYVFWHEDSKQWVMVLAVPLAHNLEFYSSQDLKAWEKMSEFGGVGVAHRPWEKSLLIELPIAGTEASRWVLMVTGPGREDGFSGVQYFIGDFDGKRFKAESASSNWLDMGKDFSGLTIGQFPERNEHSPKSLLIGWMNNKAYVKSLPKRPWQGTLSSIRSLELRQTSQGVRLAQIPIDELRHLREDSLLLKNADLMLINKKLKETKMQGLAFDIELEVKLKEGSDFELEIFKGYEAGTLIGYDGQRKEFYLDRRSTSTLPISDVFSSKETMSLPLEDDTLKLRILLDHSTIEVFINDGIYVMSMLAFPAEQDNLISLFSGEGQVSVNTFNIWKMRSIWHDLTE